MVHISSLTELSMHLDITEIEIPPEVYLYNAKIEHKINVPKYTPPVFGCRCGGTGARSNTP